MAQKKDYGVEFKIQAVELGRKIGFKKAAEELGISLGMLRGWGGQYERYKDALPDSKPGTQTPDAAMRAEPGRITPDQANGLRSGICDYHYQDYQIGYSDLEPPEQMKRIEGLEAETERDEQGNCSDLELLKQMTDLLEEMHAGMDLLEEMRAGLGRCKQAVSAHSSRISILESEMRELADRNRKPFLPIWLPTGIAAIVGAAALKRKA